MSSAISQLWYHCKGCLIPRVSAVSRNLTQQALHVPVHWGNMYYVTCLHGVIRNRRPKGLSTVQIKNKKRTMDAIVGGLDWSVGEGYIPNEDLGMWTDSYTTMAELRALPMNAMDIAGNDGDAPDDGEDDQAPTATATASRGPNKKARGKATGNK